AVPIVAILLPSLNMLTESEMTIASLKSFSIFLILFGLGLGTGLLAGIYPAIYLSGFRPVSVLKGTFSFKASSVFLRKGLVVFQFVIAIVLIISVIVISQQLNFRQTRDLGFNQSQRIRLPVKSDQ